MTSMNPQSDTPTPTNPITQSPPPISDQNILPLAPPPKVDLKQKLKEKRQMLLERRTGVERRRLVEEMKTKAEVSDVDSKMRKAQKNPMRTIALDTIHQILMKFGVNDINIEQSIMQEIAMGHLKTQDQIAAYIINKLKVLMPMGPKVRPTDNTVQNVTGSESTPSQSIPPTSNLPPSSTHRSLKHPSKNLVE